MLAGQASVHRVTAATAQSRCAQLHGSQHSGTGLLISNSRTLAGGYQTITGRPTGLHVSAGRGGSLVGLADCCSVACA